MKILKLSIDGIGGIGALELIFGPSFNLLCGPNGIGKTTILECIGHSFTSGHTLLLQRNVKFEEGSFTISFEREGEKSSRSFKKKSFHPRDQQQESLAGYHELAKHVLVLKTNRSFEYQSLSALSHDPEKEVHTLYSEAARGIGFQDIKNWLVQREMWAPHAVGLSEVQKGNLDLAKQCFAYLDDRVSFDRVIPATYDVMIKTSQGSVYLEYLSAGYKSCLCLVIGLIKEIEHRFKNPDIDVQKFDGVVTIDELDLHLHPEWQAKLVQILKRVFPTTQFIAATHSPHMIQAAAPNEIIPLAFNADCNVEIVSLPSNSGFQGWTVEEILTDVMGMTDVRSVRFKELVSQFGKAIDLENAIAAREAYDLLDGFLHPANELRKLFRFQLAQISSAAND